MSTEKTFYVVEDVTAEWGMTPVLYSNEAVYESVMDGFRECNSEWNWDEFPSGDDMTVSEIVDRVENDKYFYSAENLMQEAVISDEERTQLEEALEA